MNKSSMYAYGATASLIALIVLGIVSEMWLVPLRPGGSWLVFKVVPLLLILRGVIKRNNYIMQWSSMLILLYFTEGIVRATSDKSPLSAQLAWLQVLLCCVFFACVLAYLRPLKKAAKQKAKFLDQCRQMLGNVHVITDATDMASYLIDYRKRYTGAALAVLKPATTEQVAAIVKLCAAHQIALVPQGGNTGLVLGSVPEQTGRAVVLSLRRLNQIRYIDPINNTITVEAGCILQRVQQAADAEDRFFPLSLASEGSCTIGGNLATNAGGTAVLHYGNCRALCLGLEVVTPQGVIWDGLRALRKDNTGYDLRDLYIGSEGTLGVITAAVLQLFPKPKNRSTALAAVDSIDAALLLFNLARTNNNDAVLSAFELISDDCFALVKKYLPELKPPTLATAPYYVLIEFTSQADAIPALENVLTLATERQMVKDAVVATSLAQSTALWTWRESISEAQAAEGKNIKHDIALPISMIGQFIQHTDALLQQHFPGCRMVTFGHLGDGNLHYNVSAPLNCSSDEFMQKEAAINRIVYDSVTQFRGSISAEHGLGMLKRTEILRHKSPTEMQLMRAIKHAFDPNNIMNPGKVL